VVGPSVGRYIVRSLRIDDVEETAVAVHYYRIVAIDHRQPRDGRAIEELGTYDPHVPNQGNSVTLRPARIKYWKSVGAKASEHCEAIFTKYLAKWEEIEAGQAAKAAADAAKSAAGTEPAPQ
jgi:small subunit ribosomal protein S16